MKAIAAICIHGSCLQADYDPHRDNEFSVTPLVRLFKGTTLGEAGVNLDGGVYFHIMQTF
jgi:hypothetical protein